MLMEGPKGRLTYSGFGKFKLARNEAKKTKIGCVAGGTGITPCY
jgi:ferredoxin-NADP reductase